MAKASKIEAEEIAITRDLFRKLVEIQKVAEMLLNAIDAGKIPGSGTPLRHFVKRIEQLDIASEQEIKRLIKDEKAVYQKWTKSFR